MTLAHRRTRHLAVAIGLLALPLVAWSCPSVDGTFLRAESQTPQREAQQAARRAAAPSEEAADEPAECEIPYAGVVAVVPIRTRHAFAKAVAARDSAQVVYATDDTAIYEDGRVLTTRLEDVGEHLTLLGWAGNPMRILGASSRPESTFASTATGRTSSTGRSAKRRRG